MEIHLSAIFNIVEIETPYLKEIVLEVISQISNFVEISEIDFGNFYEGNTFTGEVGEVTEHGDIIIDSKKLQKYEKNIAMALVAHEFAHYYLKQYNNINTEDLAQETEADELAKKWGFDIDSFRKIFVAHI